MIPEISVFHRAYDSFGGHPVFGLAGDYLELRLREAPENYGVAVREIHATLWLRTEKAGPRRTLEELFAGHQAKLDRLQRIAFRRNRYRMELDYETRLVRAEIGTRAVLTPELFQGVVSEIAGRLPLIREMTPAPMCSRIFGDGSRAAVASPHWKVCAGCCGTGMSRMPARS